jgi:2-iminobutanoate/2-iminopropanoate deaminase
MTGRSRGIVVAGGVGVVIVGILLTVALRGGRPVSQLGGGRRVIRAGPSTAGLPYSPGILVGNTLYLAGTIGEDAANNIVSGGIKAETRQALTNVGQVLKAAGMSFQDVTSVTVFITSFDDFAGFNEVYQEVFSTEPPARATVQVAALIGGARVELQMVAVGPHR